MRPIYWLFAIGKSVVPWQSEGERVALEAEMTTEFDKLKDSKYFGWLHRTLNSVWFRFFLAMAFIPAERKVQRYVFPQTQTQFPDQFDEDLDDYDDEEDGDDV